MLTRRAVTTAFAGLFASLGLKVEPGQALVGKPVQGLPVEAYPINHNIFGNRAVEGMSWGDAKTMQWSMMERAKFTPSHAIPTYEDLQAEIHAAVLTETSAEISQEWLSKVRAVSPMTGRFDQAVLRKVAPEAPVEDLHSALPTMMKAAATDDRWLNTAIVSPTALTIMQSATGGPFSRLGRDHAEPPFTFGPKLVGYLPVDEKRKLRLLVDEYGRDDAPVLLGHVADRPEERSAQIVRTGISEVTFGHTPNYLKGWKRIDIDTRSLTFL